MARIRASLWRMSTVKIVKVHVSNFGEHFNFSGLHKAWNQHHCTSGSITEAQLIPGVLGEQRCHVAYCKAIGDPKLGTLATCQVRKQRILYHLLLPALKYCGNSSKLLLPGRSERKYFGFSKAPPPSKSVLQVWSDVPNAHSESLWSPQSTCANCASSSGFLAKYMQKYCKACSLMPYDASFFLNLKLHLRNQQKRHASPKVCDRKLSAMARGPSSVSGSESWSSWTNTWSSWQNILET